MGIKHWLVLAGVALLGSMVGVAAATIVAAHSAAVQPPASGTQG